MGGEEDSRAFLRGGVDVTRRRLLQNTFLPRKNAGSWLGYKGDEILPSYIGIMINHYKDPYYSFFFVAHLSSLHLDVSIFRHSIGVF